MSSASIEQSRTGDRRLGPVISSRRLWSTLKGKRTFATAEIGKPRRQGRNWICPFWVSNIQMQEVCYAYGVDSLQALVLALEGIRKVLDNSGRVWSWIHAEEGETGMPRHVPMGFGRKFASEIEAYIERKTKKFASMAERRALASRR